MKVALRFSLKVQKQYIVTPFGILADVVMQLYIESKKMVQL